MSVISPPPAAETNKKRKLVAKGIRQCLDCKSPCCMDERRCEPCIDSFIAMDFSCANTRSDFYRGHVVDDERDARLLRLARYFGLVDDDDLPQVKRVQNACFNARKTQVHYSERKKKRNAPQGPVEQNAPQGPVEPTAPSPSSPHDNSDQSAGDEEDEGVPNGFQEDGVPKGFQQGGDLAGVSQNWVENTTQSCERVLFTPIRAVWVMCVAGWDLGRTVDLVFACVSVVSLRGQELMTCSQCSPCGKRQGTQSVLDHLWSPGVGNFLASKTPEEFQNFVDLVRSSGCVHTSLLRSIKGATEEVDGDRGDGLPEADSEQTISEPERLDLQWLFAHSDNPVAELYLVPVTGAHGDLAVVIVFERKKKKEGIRCTSCPDRRGCIHTRNLALWRPFGQPVGRPAGFEKALDQETGELKSTCKSWVAIPEDWDDATILRARLARLQWETKAIALQSIILGVSASGQFKPAFLNTDTHYYLVQIPAEGYDGYEDTVLNLNNTHLYSWALLRQYWNQSEHGTMSYSAFYNALVQKWREAGCVPPESDSTLAGMRKHFQSACVNFVQLMGIDYANQVGCCNGENGIYLDGTKLWIQSRVAWLVNSWRSTPSGRGKAGTDVWQAGPPSADVMFLLEPGNASVSRLRALVKQYTGGTGYDKKTHKTKSYGNGLDATGYGEMCALIAASCGLPITSPLGLRIVSLGALVGTPVTKPPLNNLFSSAESTVLLRALGSDYPVASLLWGDRAKLVEPLVESPELLTRHSPLIEDLRLESPLIYMLLQQGTNNWTASLDPKHRLLLREIIKISLAPFEREDRTVHEERKASPIYDDVERRENVRDYFLTGHYYPNNPVLAWRSKVPLYAADRNAKSGVACNKFYQAAGVNTPGFILVFCKKHGNLVGFHLLKFAESARSVHELLFTRWNHAPEWVIYDNGCNAYKFMLAREPDFYRNTSFCIDRLHVAGHTACSPAFSPYLYRLLIGQNTEITEQNNARYTCKRAQLYMMGQLMFLFHIRHFIYQQRKRTEKKKLPRASFASDSD